MFYNKHILEYISCNLENDTQWLKTLTSISVIYNYEMSSASFILKTNLYFVEIQKTHQIIVYYKNLN